LHLLNPCLTELQNYLSTTISALTMDSTQLAQRINELQSEVEKIRAKFRQAERIADAATKEAIEQIQKEFVEVSANIRSTVDQAFGTGPVEETGYMKRIRKLLSSNTSKSQQDIVGKITAVNKEISKMLQDEFARTRLKLEEIAANRLKTQYDTLKAHVQPLVCEVEAKVKQEIDLDLPFREFHLELSPPTEKELHESVANMANIISHSKTSEIRDVSNSIHAFTHFPQKKKKKKKSC
jgi:hypothetical protein